MELISLNVAIRQKKDNIKTMRRVGFIPAVLYGKNILPVILSLNAQDFYLAFSKYPKTSFINLASENSDINGKIVVIKDIQKDPVKDNIIHLDLHEVSMDEKIEIEALIHFTGKPEGVKLGGILEPILRHITIKGLPKDIVDVINIDVSALKIGDIIHVKDLKVPEELEIDADGNAAVVTVAEPTVEEVTTTVIEGAKVVAELAAEAKTEKP